MRKAPKRYPSQRSLFYFDGAGIIGDFQGRWVSDADMM